MFVAELLTKYKLMKSSSSQNQTLNIVRLTVKKEHADIWRTQVKKKSRVKKKTWMKLKAKSVRIITYVQSKEKKFGTDSYRLHSSKSSFIIIKNYAAKYVKAKLPRSICLHK